MPPKRSKVRKAASAQAAKPAKSTPANSPKKQATKKDNASQVQSSEAADKENDSDNVCSICMDTPSKMDVTKLSGCKHLFCFDCIEAWSKEENTCPLCKEVSLVLSYFCFSCQPCAVSLCARALPLLLSSHANTALNSRPRARLQRPRYPQHPQRSASLQSLVFTLLRRARGNVRKASPRVRR